MEGRPTKILFLLLLLIFSISCSSKKKKREAKRLAKRMAILKTLSPSKIKSLRHETNILKIFKKVLTLGDYYESYKRSDLLKPFPPQLGKGQTPYGFELINILGGTDQQGQDHRWCQDCHSKVCCPNWDKSPAERGRPIKFLMQLKKWQKFKNEPSFHSFYLGNIKPGDLVTLNKSVVSANIPFSGYEFKNFSYFLNNLNRKLLYRLRIKSWLPNKNHLNYKNDAGRWSNWSPPSKIIGWNRMLEKWQVVKIIKKNSKVQRVDYGPFYR